MSSSTCSCSGGLKLIFACSGASDVGAIADQSARKLSQIGVGKMYCAVGIGGRVSGIMETTKAAQKILVLDGCPLNCVKNCLQQAGFDNFLHLQLADMGLQKGKSPMSAETIESVVRKASELLA